MNSLTSSCDNIITPPALNSPVLDTPPKSTPASKQLLNILNSGNFEKHKKKLLNNFKLITPEELQQVLTSYFEGIAEKTTGKDHLKTVDQLAKLIPFTKLQAAAFSDHKSALIKAKAELHQAKYYLQNRKTKASPTLQAKVSAILDKIINFIESILNAFGVAELFKPATSMMQKQNQFQKIMTLVGFFSMITSMAEPLLGAAIAGPIIGGTLLFIGALSFIYPKIAPIPSHLPYGAKNWTKECQFGKLTDLSFTKGRKDILDEMASTLINSQKGSIKKHPLLTGESRVGKTQTAKAFVQAIERGDYPELKGKKVFYISTPKLCKESDMFEGKDPLDSIAEEIKHHKQDIILVLDEIHVAFKGEKFSLISQKLKDMLDAGGDLPYVIAITTTKEFLHYNMDKDEAFVNRFHPIKIESTGPEVTQEILTQSLLKSKEKALFEKDALQMIYQKTKHKPQPYTSDLVLKKCIDLTSKNQKPSGKKKIQELNNTKEFLASKGVASPLNTDAEDNIQEQIENLEQEIVSLKKELKIEQKQFDQLYQSRSEIFQVKARICSTVMKMQNVTTAKLCQRNKQDLSSFMLMKKFLGPALEAHVRKKGKELGINVFIDETIINKAVSLYGAGEQNKADSFSHRIKSNDEVIL
jgi:ATP-dependent Clp protease ATP-binding subunit ClpA